jgi:adenosylcobinamide-GDP ribazoletransferase
MAAGLAFVGAILLCGSSAILALVAVAAVAALTARLAQAKLGGQTGDVLGATQFLAELAALLVLGA